VNLATLEQQIVSKALAIPNCQIANNDLAIRKCQIASNQDDACPRHLSNAGDVMLTSSNQGQGDTY
jgi:hypothetical protein